jgi:hypothetical protein
LRYEEFTETSSRIKSGLKEFLMEKAMKKEEIAHCMHWYLLLESSNTDNVEEVQNFYGEILDDLKENL